ncbi:MAG: TetR family transcriptional regulator [Deltaproteobacteria bacterium]|nr:TetR family transcriptional regulator [Deltaproteobacteria bacterium]
MVRAASAKVATRVRRPKGLDTRARIVRAALSAFADLGYDGATTRDIAERAGVNQGLITYHFAGKLPLWQAAVDEIFDTLRAHFAAHLPALAEADAATRLRLMVRHYVRFAAAHPELHRLMMQEGKHDGPRMQWLVDRHVRPLYQLSTGLIAEAQRAGLVPDVPPLHLHYLLVGAVAHLFVVAPEIRRLSGRDPLRPAAIEAHADAVTAVLFGPAVSATR